MAIVLTLLLLEAVLSFDNAAILAALVRKLPREQRRKALLYGLVGAYALRISAILLAAFLIRNPWLKAIGGGYLIYIALKHFWDAYRHKVDEHEVHFSGNWLVRMGVPTFVAVIIQIELVDLAFAVDQVIAAVAYTDKIQLIIIASIVGILFLRLAAAFMAQVMDWLPTLEHMAFIAVGFVGSKLMLEMVHIEVPTFIAVGVTLALFGVPVFLKLIFGIPRSRPGDDKEPDDAANDAPAEEPTDAWADDAAVGPRADDERLAAPAKA